MSIQDDLLTLATLDRRAVRAVVESDWETLATVLSDYLALRRSLRRRSLDQSVASIADVDAAAALRKIVGGEGLPTDRILEQLSASTTDQNHEEFSEEELEALGSDLLYSWFSHFEYVAGLAELRPLVVRGSVAEGVSQLVGQIKNCYAFQQYDAAYTLCRTVIEAAIRDICVRCGLFPDHGPNVILLEKFSWGQLRDKVSSGSLRERLKVLYSDLSTVLHGRKSVTKDEARRVFGETLELVEALYATHGL